MKITQRMFLTEALAISALAATGSAQAQVITGTPVSLVEYHYGCPFKFTGTIDRLTIDPGEFRMAATDQKKSADGTARSQD